MRKLIACLVPLLLSCAAQADEFARVRCDGDVVKALTGRRESNQPVMKTEAKYKSLGLAHLGADIVADDINTISWRICGKEYLVLDKRSVIGDVIEFPAHSKSAPPFAGACKVKGVETKETIVAVLDDADGKGEQLPAKAAWRIDEKAAKFVKMETADMLCPRSGVYHPAEDR